MANLHRVIGHLRRRRHRQRRERIFLPRVNPFAFLPPGDIFERFRFRPATIYFILGLIAEALARPTSRNKPLEPMMQLLCTLRFLATGAFYNCIGDTLGVTKSSVGRSVDNVTNALCRLGQDWIVFPVGQTLATVQRAFHDIAGFPNVAGCIDGVFIRIQAPKDDEQDFVNRKGYHSLNCQMTCDASYRITSCVCKWPGSCHDSRMLRDSNLNNKYETGQYNGILLGDSAYPTRRFLMTPYNNPTTPQQHRFNNALCKTRVKIEQTYGILKRRFACLHSGLRVDPNKVARIITACAVLHNIGINKNDIINIEDDHINAGDQPINFIGVNDGNATRDHICTTFF